MTIVLKFKRPEWNGYKKLVWPGCKEDRQEVLDRVEMRGYDYVLMEDGKVVRSRL